jgi:hypothetical protein
MRILSITQSPLHSIPYRTARPGGGQELADLPLLEAEVDALPEGVQAVLATADLQAREVLPGQRLLGEVLAAECIVLAGLGQLPPAEHMGVLLAGDFYTDLTATIRGSSGDVRSVWEAMAHRFRWVTGVPATMMNWAISPSTPRETCESWMGRKSAWMGCGLPDWAGLSAIPGDPIAVRRMTFVVSPTG